MPITGEIVWKHDGERNTPSIGVSGGIQATAILGKNSISDLVIIPFARTPNENDGVHGRAGQGDGRCALDI